MKRQEANARRQQKDSVVMAPREVRSSAIKMARERYLRHLSARVYMAAPIRARVSVDDAAARQPAKECGASAPVPQQCVMRVMRSEAMSPAISRRSAAAQMRVA